MIRVHSDDERKTKSRFYHKRNVLLHNSFKHLFDYLKTAIVTHMIKLSEEIQKKKVIFGGITFVYLLVAREQKVIPVWMNKRFLTESRLSTTK